MSHATSRRQFLKTAAVGAAAVSMSAASYAQTPGANDRIRIGIIGCGSRGFGAHMPGVYRHTEAENITITAVCDPWGDRRREAAARAKEWYGGEVREFVHYEDLLALDDIDAVMIASCDHQHTRMLKAAAEAKKDVYCEKPLSMDVDSLNAAYDAVKANNVVMQSGTQLRSYPSFTGCREVYRSGLLGTVGRIEQCRNSSSPYWYGYAFRDCREDDVDWPTFLMGAPEQPFNPVKCAGWYGYLDFTDGPVPGLGSHFIDLVHYITGATFPTDAVCSSGICTWKDEYNFTCPDHVQAVWHYPEGFMVSYSTNFGNGSGSTFKFFGNKAVMDCVAWEKPTVSSEGCKGETPAVEGVQPVEPVERPDHFQDWLQCIRTRNTPNAGIDAGYQHAIAVLMAVKASNTGKRQVWDAANRQIVEG